ncbi:MAG TPA: GGDEF domain-containing protein, partial [Acidimicrobiales bacterium]|nr:GGDEF domain-containing protein [Acidimicrobiales bacterium]
MSEDDVPSRRRSLRRVGRGGVASADRPSESAVSLGLALRARTDELAEQITERWEAGRGDPAPVTERVREDVVRFCRSGTAQITTYLITGVAATAEQTASQATPGRAAANQSVSLADLMKMHLIWRDVTIEMLQEEADRLESDPEALGLAVAVSRSGSDAAIVRVAKVFDAHRNQLQGQLEEEQTRLTHQALHDALTGLPNRVLFLERLAQSIEGAERRSI